jgi:hypothetical protein
MQIIEHKSESKISTKFKGRSNMVDAVSASNTYQIYNRVRN